jgi:hypothetical protein
MSTFTIIETQAYDITWAVEASSIDEARRAFVETGAGERIDEQPHDTNGITLIIDPCGETVYEALSPAERAIRNIHAALDGKEWTPEFLDYIAGEVEAFGLKVRGPLTECELCDQTEVEQDAPEYEIPIDLHGPDGKYLAEAGDVLLVCPACQASIEDEAIRNHRGL